MGYGLKPMENPAYSPSWRRITIQHALLNVVTINHVVRFATIGRVYRVKALVNFGKRKKVLIHTLKIANYMKYVLEIY